MVTTELKVEGFHCASCKTLVLDIVSDYPAITACTVDVKTGRVVLEHEKTFDVTSFCSELTKVGGYTVKVIRK